MDLRQIINQVNRDEDRQIQEDLRNLNARMEPTLAESAQLSNKLAGLEGQRYEKSDPEGYAADMERYRALGKTLAAFERERHNILDRQNARDKEPIDPAPLLEQARRELEDQRHRLSAAVSLALRYRSPAYVQDYESALDHIAYLEPLVEALEQAVEETEVLT
jgi:hypothetical protein